MAVPPTDPERYRRQQRRRALLGWGIGLAATGLLVLALVLGADDAPRREPVAVPYGELMTAAEYEAIDEGESEAEVLETLGKSGRPESLTEDYVLVLFPPPASDVVCSYWEFSDEPRIFARLCFDDSGSLIEKRARDVHDGLEEGAGAITA